MANKTSYAYQKELLGKLKEHLEVFKEDISNASMNYKASVQNLHDQNGLMDETYEEYNANYLKPSLEALYSMIERMETEDIAFVEKEIEFLASR